MKNPKATAYVRRRKGSNDVFEFIDYRTYKDAEGEEFKMKTVLKEDNKKDLSEAIRLLQKQIDDKAEQKLLDTYKEQLAMIEEYEAKNPIEEQVMSSNEEFVN